MEPVYKVYLQDLQFKNNPNEERRTVPEIQQILHETAPYVFRPKIIRSTNRGYLITHSEDKDLNFIFNLDVINKLHSYHLKADLGEDIQLLRQIVVTIPDQSSDIFSNSESTLTNVIQTENNIAVLSLRKFKSDNTQGEYLFITVASVESCKSVIDKGSITVFNKQIPAEKARTKKYKPKSSQHHQGSYFNYNNHQGSYPNYNYQNFPQLHPSDTSSKTTQGSYSNYTSDQGRDQALSANSSWGGKRYQDTRLPVDTRRPPPNYQVFKIQQHHSSNGPLRTNPPTAPDPVNLQSNITTHQSDLIIKSFIEATSKISETISNGMENPETYLSIVNEALSKKEIPTVFVSKQNLLDSRKLYLLNKSANPPNTHLPRSPQHTPVKSPTHPSPDNTLNLTNPLSSTASSDTSHTNYSSSDTIYANSGSSISHNNTALTTSTTSTHINTALTTSTTSMHTLPNHNTPIKPPNPSNFTTPTNIKTTDSDTCTGHISTQTPITPTLNTDRPEPTTPVTPTNIKSKDPDTGTGTDTPTNIKSKDSDTGTELISPLSITTPSPTLTTAVPPLRRHYNSPLHPVTNSTILDIISTPSRLGEIFSSFSTSKVPYSYSKLTLNPEYTV